jgi:hypothetical protein
MVEYGNGVGQSTGAGGGTGGGHPVDAGAAIGQMVADAVHNVSSLPPGTLLLGLVVLVVGLMILRRAL